MKLPLVGVLGCGGALGRVACDVLQRSCRIRGGQRSQPQAFTDKDVFEWVQMDLYDSAALLDFCRGCDVILNCASPSYRIGDRVALAAAESGAGYVDAFGADPLEKSLSEKIAAANGLFVISAGCFPGLSGVLSRWLSAQGFEIVDSMHAFAGGREHCSAGAGADLLLSSVSGFGVPDAFWRDGAVVRNSRALPDEVYIPGFKEEVYVQRFLNSETIRLADLLKLHEAHWYNIVADKHIADIISKSCARLAVDAGDDVLRESVSELAATASLALSGASPWYTMMIEAQGTSHGETVRKRAVLQSLNSYRLSGVVAAVTVEAILKQREIDGMYWAFEFLNPDEVMSKLLTSKAVERFNVVDIPSVFENILFKEMEEGVL